MLIKFQMTGTESDYEQDIYLVDRLVCINGSCLGIK